MKKYIENPSGISLDVLLVNNVKKYSPQTFLTPQKWSTVLQRTNQPGMTWHTLKEVEKGHLKTLIITNRYCKKYLSITIMMLHKSLTICSADVKCEPLLWAHLERSSLPAELVQSPLISTHWRPGQHCHIAVTWVRTHNQQHIIQIKRAYWYDNVFNIISPPRRITNFKVWI